jgi:anhydro-N-acetylmuramic acid kinase
LNDLKEYNVVGVMSGTSLDGLDIAHCSFKFEADKWHFRINRAETISYPEIWGSLLRDLHKASALDFAKTDVNYGKYIGENVSGFLSRYDLNADLVASHGHTIFHQPAAGYTVQIGHGEQIAAVASLPVVCDFRSLDVALGGQGAPLVPLGDRLLFANFPFCLNIGGFANISFDDSLGLRRAFDICPANYILNRAARQLGHQYDKNGLISRKGQIHHELLKELNKIAYYNLGYPKSLGREFVEKEIDPLIQKFDINPENLLCTMTEHIALQIAVNINTLSVNPSEVLVTGGGANNIFLLERITQLCRSKIIVPEKNIVDYKEALIFAFLGLLRWQGETNTLASVTGARCNSSGGAVYLHPTADR